MNHRWRPRNYAEFLDHLSSALPDGPLIPHFYMHQVAHIDHNWRKPDEMCYQEFMDTELLKESWEKLTQRGYTLNSPAPEVVNIITPTGYSTQIRLKRLPSYARYVR